MMPAPMRILALPLTLAVLAPVVFAQAPAAPAPAKAAAPAADWRAAPAADWQTIFNGKDLDGWVVKLAHHEVGDNYGDTFRVADGVIRVDYDKYHDDFGT